MHGNVTTLPTAEKPPVIKHRIITITNRAPIRILEDDWPIHAQGKFERSFFFEGDEYGHDISIVLRKHKDLQEKIREHEIHEILHARYSYTHPFHTGDETDNRQIVRVGRLLAWEAFVIDGRMQCQSIDDIWRHIREVGEELRERIINVEHKRHVTLAVDDLFANLEPL